MRLLVAGLFVLALVLGIANFTSGYQRTLSEDDIQSAIAYGTSRKGRTFLENTNPHLIVLPEGLGWASVYTAWLDIALLAQIAAVEFRPFTAADARRFLSVRSYKVLVSTEITYGSRDFWVNSHGVLIQSSLVVQPTRKQGRYLNVVSCYSQPCLVRAQMEFRFGDEGLNTDQPADFILSIASGLKELRVPVPFGAMK